MPPTGAKGLNLAVNDARLLAGALAGWYRDGSTRGLERTRDGAAAGVAGAGLLQLHDPAAARPRRGPFERRLQLARLEHWRSEAAARSLAENYAGLPAKPDF